MQKGSRRESIIGTAAQIADEKGAAFVTMKELAGRLGIRSPSLYKHFSGGLEELNRELMLYGWRLMDEEITKAVIGKERDDAVIALCRAYRSFVCEHRGLYEAMQWYNMYLSEEHLQASEKAVEIMFRALSSYGLAEEQKVHCVRMMRAFMHGFSSIESHSAYGNPVPLDESFDFALKTMLEGISCLKKDNEL
ncbi:MAG: WHG domain-containing protein [Ruminococcus sp.]|nr:WHG domain-containing protein [Ruminococcus sp.]